RGFEHKRQRRSGVDRVPLPRLGEIGERLRALSGATHVASATNPPLGRQTHRTFKGIGGEPIDGNVTYFDGDYFGAVGMPLLHGTLNGTLNGTTPIVINETLARRRPDLPFSGVARDARLSAIAEDPAPHLFLPIERAPALRNAFLVIRTTRDLAVATRDVHAVL